MANRWRAALVGTLALAGLLPFGANADPPGMSIEVLSNRADLVSGGDALVEIVVSEQEQLDQLTVELNGQDVTDAFGVRADGRYYGLVTGQHQGQNQLVAHLGAGGAAITLTNHPSGGPVFSGPQVQPWVCTTAHNGLGEPVDEDCNAAAPVYEYFYRPTDSTAFEPYDPANPPDDVATTTTDEGEQVPYVIRRERGAMNRGLYQVAVLFDPAEPWTAWNPQSQWNGKLFYPFGASCNTDYHQGTFDNSVLNDRALSRGFAVATSTLNILGQNCNTVTSAESTMMLKERFVEQYGEVRYTFGIGGSGGSIGQFAVSNAYPGLLQGLIPSATYADVWTTALEVYDCHLLATYFAKSPNLWPDPAQQAAVNGHEGVSSCVAWKALFAPTGDPSHGCGLLMASQIPTTSGRTPDDYDPVLNPDGCRATIQDLQVGIWGRRQQDGFAKQPFDNVGLQYGLVALNDGVISVDQFLDLNEKIGGLGIDRRPTGGRSLADPDTPLIAHRSAQVNDTRGLGDIAVIDVPPPTNYEIHTPFHAFAIEQRFVNAHGHAENHAIWRGGSNDVAFDTMDTWLSAVEADTSDAPRSEKVVRNRPAEAVDSCFVEGTQVTDEAQCDVAYPYYGDARIAAGGPFSGDVMKCMLKSPARDEYPSMTDGQWARLQSIFPTGVCDFSVPGVGQVPSQPWMTFAGGPGGEALPPAPESAAL